MGYQVKTEDFLAEYYKNLKQNVLIQSTMKLSPG
jgi:hypothetical protein